VKIVFCLPNAVHHKKLLILFAQKIRAKMLLKLTLETETSKVLKNNYFISLTKDLSKSLIMFYVFIKHNIVVKKTFANSLTFASEKKKCEVDFLLPSFKFKSSHLLMCCLFCVVCWSIACVCVFVCVCVFIFVCMSLCVCDCCVTSLQF
jgi:hypothetical protein